MGLCKLSVNAILSTEEIKIVGGVLTTPISPKHSYFIAIFCLNLGSKSFEKFQSLVLALYEIGLTFSRVVLYK